MKTTTSSKPTRREYQVDVLTGMRYSYTVRGAKNAAEAEKFAVAQFHLDEGNDDTPLPNGVTARREKDPDSPHGDGVGDTIGMVEYGQVPYDQLAAAWTKHGEALLDLLGLGDKAACGGTSNPDLYPLHRQSREVYDIWAKAYGQHGEAIEALAALAGAR